MTCIGKFSWLAALRIATTAVVLAIGALPAISQTQSDQAGKTLRIGGTGSALGTMRLIAQAFMKANPDIQVTVLPSLGSGGGIKAVAADKINVGVSARPLKDAERAMGIDANEYARTPIVFASRYDNPADGITLEQIEAAYSGQDARWPDGTHVRLILRPATETDNDLIRGMSAKLDGALDGALKRSELHVAVNDQDNATALEKVPGSLGLITVAQAVTEKRRLKLLALNGVAATPETLQSGEYPYLKSFYLVLQSDPEPAADAFARFVYSQAGQAILAATGHVPVVAEQGSDNPDPPVGQ